MSTFAKLSIMGYIGGRLRFSDKSKYLLTSFQVAVNRNSINDDNQLTDWYDILCKKIS